MNSETLEQQSIGIAYQLNVIEQAGYHVGEIRDNMESVFSRAFQDSDFRNTVRKDVDIVLYHLDNVIIYMMRGDNDRATRTLNYVDMIARGAVNV